MAPMQSRGCDPATYLRIVGSLIPRELILQREQGPDVDYADLSNDEICELFKAERERRFIEIGLESVRREPHRFAALK